MPDHAPVSLWDVTALESAPGAQDTAPEPRVDLAIVGGGITGLSTALHAAQAGLSVQVIEAGRLGEGGSGRNVGLVNAGVWMPPAAVRAALGQDRGERFLDLFGDAPRAVFDLIERHQIRCAATRTGTIHAAHAPRAMADLRGRHDAWEARGAPVTLLDAAEVSRLTGSRAFHGGLVDARAGTINPMAYCRGLARAARGAGAAITTGCRVTGLRHDGGAWQVDTPRGPVAARDVVLATNAYTDTLWPGLADSLVPLRFVQVATEPLGTAGADILPDGQGLWDTGRVMRALRRDAEGRLILGTMGRLHGDADAGLTRRWAMRQIGRLYPDLPPVRIESAWDGVIAMTPDHLPRIHQLADGLYTPIGYNGRGITTGTVFGAAMARLLTGGDPDDLPLPLGSPATAPRGRLTARLLDAALSAHQALRAL
ncbi:NAD(P)/FAD-dependent oxidoreductase [Roseivivax jejudonensis]|uniref:NAD(P)/FAD-dependent oxidoreductase n=1 Tax=Roseivivax jejudonensis TaxID=1529041 RepID=UPI001F3C7622|nr:FAD-binding oxidoreductase [Roseivivax jejudonensis]